MSFYFVESLLGKIYDHNGKQLFLVKWLGYSEQQATWQPIEHLSNCTDLIQNLRESQNNHVYEDLEDDTQVSENLSEEEMNRQNESYSVFDVDEYLMGPCSESESIVSEKSCIESQQIENISNTDNFKNNKDTNNNNEMIEEEKQIHVRILKSRTSPTSLVEYFISIRNVTGWATRQYIEQFYPKQLTVYLNGQHL